MGFRAERAHHGGMDRRPDKARLDELLDEALKETFPASDPVSAFSGDTPRRPSAGAEGPARDEGEHQADEHDVHDEAVDEPGQDERRTARPGKRDDDVVHRHPGQ